MAAASLSRSPPRVELREITRASVRDFLRLKVKPGQEHFVAPNAVSISQAHFHPESWFRGIVAGGEPVGFAMLEDWMQCPEKAPADWRADAYVGLWRFMIDARYQRRGIGRQALALVFAYVKERPGAKEVLTSCVDAPGGPGPFYEGLGFAYTGEVDEGERVMRRPL